jgi:hypothetical protein
MNAKLASMEAQLIELYKERETLAAHFPGLTAEEIVAAAAALQNRLNAAVEDQLVELAELRVALMEAFPEASLGQIIEFAKAGIEIVAPELESSLDAQLRDLYEERQLLAEAFPGKSAEEIAADLDRKLRLLEQLGQAA